MRSLMFLLVLVLFCSVPMTSSAPYGLHSTNCCMEFSNVKVPVKRVKSFYWTSSTCARRAIVFQMISGKEFCVDPETSWVNRHVAEVDKRITFGTTTTSSSSSSSLSTTTTSAATTATTAKTQSPKV